MNSCVGHSEYISTCFFSSLFPTHIHLTHMESNWKQTFFFVFFLFVIILNWWNIIFNLILHLCCVGFTSCHLCTFIPLILDPGLSNVWRILSFFQCHWNRISGDWINLYCLNNSNRDEWVDLLLIIETPYIRKCIITLTFLMNHLLVHFWD